MRVVIEIPDEEYKVIKKYADIAPNKTHPLAMSIINGTVLPEKHGDLIDINDIQEITLEDSLHIMTYKKGNGVEYEIDAPTILEAREDGE